MREGDLRGAGGHKGGDSLCDLPEKCFDKTRYEYLELGDCWARVHQGRVEQCVCVGGQVQCEGTRHTGTLCWASLGVAGQWVGGLPWAPARTEIPEAQA